MTISLRVQGLFCGLTSFIILIFFTSFFLNFFWEEVHQILYISYKGKEITDFILFRAALVDASIITFSYLVSFILKRKYLFFVLTFLFALYIEWWALGTGRWVYSNLMPAVPILGVGLSPLIQLAVTGIISEKITTLCCRFLKGGVIR